MAPRWLLLALAVLLLAGCGGAPGAATRSAAVSSSASAATGSANQVTAAMSASAALAASAPPGGMGPAPTPPVPPTATPAPLRFRLVDALSGAAVPCGGVRAAGAPLQALPSGDCDLPARPKAADLTAAGYEPAPLPAQDGAAVRLVPTPEAVAKAYLAALQAGQWATLWTLSSPQAQARWPDEQAFTSFLRARFAPDGKPVVSAVDVGPAAAVPAWDDVRFTRQPVAAERAPAQLTLAASPAYPAEPAGTVLKRPMVLVRAGEVWKVADAGPADVQGPVLVPAHAAPRQLRVPIMMYHHIAPAPQRTPQMGDYDYRLAVDLTVTPEHFAAQLDWLAAHGYTTITLQQLLAALFDGAPLPAHPIVLTFDDGYADNYQYALPALQTRGMTGTFNVITGLVGRQGALNYMTWDQIAALAAAGMPVESHTVWHLDLGTLSEQDAWFELIVSHDTLAQKLGEAPQIICYPSGEPFRSESAAAQARILALATKAGYVGGLLDPKVAGDVQSSAAPLELDRIRVAGEETLAQFVASIGAA